MKSLKTKVIMSALVLVFALIATIGSTYAWFVVTDTVSVEALTINVTTQDSLLIKLYEGAALPDPWSAETDFGTTISEDDIFTSTWYTSTGNEGAYDIDNATLFPMTAASGLTTTGGTDYSTLNPTTLGYVNILNTTDRTLLTGEPNVAGGYIEIQFYLLSQSVANDVMLQNLSITSSNSILAKAVFLGTSGDSNNVFSIDPDYDFAFIDGDTGYITEDATHDNDDTISFFNDITETRQGTLIAANAQYYVSGQTGNILADDGTTIVGYGTTAGTTNVETVASLAADTPELITVRIWLEGWDEQANNDVIGANFDISFEFAIK